jgi:hypothetical protein
MLINGLINVLSSADTPIMPRFDHTLPFQHSELLFKLISQSFVCM